MNKLTKTIAIAWLVLLAAGSAALAQSTDTGRLRELRMKSRDGKLTTQEKAELDAAMKARDGGTTTHSTPTPRKAEPGQTATSATPQSREEMRQKRLAEYAERQKFVFERSRQQRRRRWRLLRNAALPMDRLANFL